jgi:hypothetical protein
MAPPCYSPGTGGRWLDQARYSDVAGCIGPATHAPAVALQLDMNENNANHNSSFAWIIHV